MIHVCDAQFLFTEQTLDQVRLPYLRVVPLGDVGLQRLRRPWGAVRSRIPSSTYLLKRTVAGCFTPLGRPPSVFLCLLGSNDKREGALRISLLVALAVDARSSVGESIGEG